VLSGALRPGRNYAPTRHSVRTAATCPGVPLSHVLPSTDSAEVGMSSCSPASLVLRCVRLPRSFMNWTYGITPSPAHPPFVLCFSCSSLPSEQSHLRRNRRFFLLDSPIPALNEGVFRETWTSRFPHKKYPHIPGCSDSARSSRNSHIALRSILPSPPGNKVGTRKK
jgi:hypothetical protein